MKNLELSHVQPHYRLLTEEQIQELHQASLNILRKTGIRVMHKEALDLLKDSGCEIKNGEVVSFPSQLVEEAIHSAPKGISVYDRSGNEAMRLEGRNSYFGTGTDLLRTVDLETGKDRPSVLQDVINCSHHFRLLR